MDLNSNTAKVEDAELISAILAADALAERLKNKPEPVVIQPTKKKLTLTIEKPSFSNAAWNAVRENLAIIVASVVVIISMLVSAASYSTAVESNSELMSLTNELTTKKIERAQLEQEYLRVLESVDIDEYAQNVLHMTQVDSIPIVLSEIEE